jgi:hypothetical protein
MADVEDLLKDEESEDEESEKDDTESNYSAAECRALKAVLKARDDGDDERLMKTWATLKSFI